MGSYNTLLLAIDLSDESEQVAARAAALASAKALEHVMLRIRIVRKWGKPNRVVRFIRSPLWSVLRCSKPKIDCERYITVLAIGWQGGRSIFRMG